MLRDKIAQNQLQSALVTGKENFFTSKKCVEKKDVTRPLSDTLDPCRWREEGGAEYDYNYSKVEKLTLSYNKVC